MVNRLRTCLASVILPSILLFAVGCNREGAGHSGEGAARVDTTNFPGKTGVVTLKASGPVIGNLSFTNAYATMVEQPIAGNTRKMLTIEGHNGEKNNHFKIRFIRDNGDIETGSYTIENPMGDPPRKLDGTFESGGAMYKAVGAATGAADIKVLTGNTVSGTFSVKLVSLSDSAKSEVLIGTYNAIIQR